MDNGESESYLTKHNPTVDDWLEHNKAFFALLRGEVSDEDAQFAFLTDVDALALEEGVTLESYFESLKEKVGPLGIYTLELSHSQMDDAWHVILAPSKKDTSAEEA